MLEDDPRNAADEKPNPAAMTRTKETEPVPQADERPESGTRGVLRDAIQKVLEEIAHHETEAKKHLQQAQELRKDLRESFAFLQDRGPKGKPTAAPVESNAAKATEPTATSTKSAATPRRKPSGTKKTRTAGKADEK